MWSLPEILTYRTSRHQRSNKKKIDGHAIDAPALDVDAWRGSTCFLSVSANRPLPGTFFCERAIRSTTDICNAQLELSSTTHHERHKRAWELIMGTGKKEATRKVREGKVGDGMANVKVKGENFYRYVKEQVLR